MRLNLAGMVALVLLVFVAVWLLDRQRRARDGMYSTEGEFLARDELLTLNGG